ncbi:serine/threonine-protein kinase GM11705-like isoform X2 [Nilaparvata lugens]|uniref:serine/threonine-protein kinase GM11705 isoform X2 n=1 Tax=Nilaparvata lugens TaxID=108931 RepID=UPI000B9886C7|nr:serine/threonine-protein kinase GM11705 isoform X2 [Nilaparvata lugens]XP_039288543.1 serine/threonine-protein kinase GM11705-like isoform X2 [Nilaparvata lugens]XP_039288546.1 serine/threonine-protein kinase GM11705-like isoform X2 [Nilaparvata lugens]
MSVVCLISLRENMSLSIDGDNRLQRGSINKLQGSFSSTDSVEVHRNASDLGVHQNSPQKTRKAKRIKFLCNGDKYCKGVTMAVTPERYRSFDSLLTDLTRALSNNVNLPSGVRTLFTMDGRKVAHIDDLEDGKHYVCSGMGDSFKRVDYFVNGNNINSAKVKPARSLTRLSGSNSPCISVRSPTPTTVVRPKIIIVVRNGTRPRKVMRLLLNKRNAPSFDHALSTITEAVKLDTGAVRKVFTSTGKQVINLQDFFTSEDLFFVYGSERSNQFDFEFDFEELRSIQAQRRGLRRTGGELKSGTHCLDELGRGVPKLPNKTKAFKVSKRQDSNNLSIPNKVLSKYSVGFVIGDGNFAVVRRCCDKTKNIDYALKIIDKSKCAGKEHMIENEVSILRSVEHPNIIRLIAEHDTAKELYLVMELVKGGDLFDAISKAVKFAESDAQVMTHNLASALTYLHEQNIVHRDIKPENLLVEMEGNTVKLLKVGDFGLAQRVTGPLFTVCGTPTYVAPEILTEVGYGLKIDVWAAGVILYILLCGFPPFVSANNDQEELFDDILSGQYGFPSPYWDDVSDSAKDLITHMLQASQDCRVSAEDVLDHPWLITR